VANLGAAEALAEYQERFGVDDGFLVKGLTDRVSNLYDEWRLFIYLFAENPERVRLLKRSSGLMFETINRSLWDGVLIKVRHLTDTKNTRKKQKNFSLEWLIDIGKIHSDCDFSSDWEGVKRDCRPIRRFVDKYIAHLDDDHARGKAQAHLSRLQTTTAVKSIGAFVQKFHSAVCDTKMVLLPTLQSHDHQHALFLLHLGIKKMNENEAAEKRDWRLAQSKDHIFPDYLTERIDWFDPF